MLIILIPAALILGLLLGSFASVKLNKILSKKLKIVLTTIYVPIAFLPLLPNAYKIYTFPLPPKAYAIKLNLLPQSGSLSAPAVEFQEKDGKSGDIATFYNSELTKRGWVRCNSESDDELSTYGGKIKFQKGQTSAVIYIYTNTRIPARYGRIYIDPWGSCSKK